MNYIAVLIRIPKVTFMDPKPLRVYPLVLPYGDIFDYIATDAPPQIVKRISKETSATDYKELRVNIINKLKDEGWEVRKSHQHFEEPIPILLTGS